MPRQPRLRVAGIPFHVIQRGHNRAPCFLSGHDRAHYLEELARQAASHGVAIHAYVLMTNHAHLLMTASDSDGIPRLMKRLGERYVRYFNRRGQRTGTLWEGRYRSCLVDTEGYLLACHRYVELNPVRAGMVERPDDYRWSSYRANALGEADPLVSPHPILDGLGREPAERRVAYQELFRDALSARVLEEIRSSTNGGFALGSDAFKKDMAQRTGRRVAPLRRGRPRSWESVP